MRPGAPWGGRLGCGAAEGVAGGGAWVPSGVQGSAKAGLVESLEVVRGAHAASLSRGCEPVGQEGSVGRPAARSLCRSCFTCGSSLEEMPARAKTLRHASTIML